MHPDGPSPYRWQRCLGRGATGEVWAAERDGKQLAVKILLDTRPDSPHAEAVKREMRLGPMLADHPGIIGVRRVETYDGTLHLEMDLVDGPNLDQVLEGRIAAGKGPIPASVATEWTIQILRTLEWAAAHVAPGKPHTFLHRDIKPANLLLDRDGQIQITDFGMARSSAELGFETTQSGIVKGTPRFMAPELLLESNVDSRADQFSTGVMLFELLSGQPLYRGRTLAEVLIKALHCEIEEQLASLRIPPSLFTVLERMLQRDSHDRFPNHHTAYQALSQLELIGCSAEESTAELLRDATEFAAEKLTAQPLATSEHATRPQAVALVETSEEDPLFPDQEITLVVRALPTMGEHVAFPNGWENATDGSIEVTFEIPRAPPAPRDAASPEEQADLPASGDMIRRRVAARSPVEQFFIGLVGILIVGGIIVGLGAAIAAGAIILFDL